MAEHPQIDDRMFVGQLPGQEAEKTDNGDHRQADDEAGREPVVILAIVDHDLQRADPGDQQPRPTKSMGFLTVLVSNLVSMRTASVEQSIATGTLM